MLDYKPYKKETLNTNAFGRETDLPVRIVLKESTTNVAMLFAGCIFALLCVIFQTKGWWFVALFTVFSILSVNYFVALFIKRKRFVIDYKGITISGEVIPWKVIEDTFIMSESGVSDGMPDRELIIVTNNKRVVHSLLLYEIKDAALARVIEGYKVAYGEKK